MFRRQSRVDGRPSDGHGKRDRALEGGREFLLKGRGNAETNGMRPQARRRLGGNTKRARKGKGRKRSCGQAEPHRARAPGQSGGLTAGLLSAAGPDSPQAEGPPQNARGTVLGKALRWSSSRPSPLPVPLPPVQRSKETTEFESNFNVKPLENGVGRNKRSWRGSPG